MTEAWPAFVRNAQVTESAAVVGDERGDLTLAQVMTHTTGLEVKPALQVHQAESVLSLVLDSQLTGAPGRFAYKNVAVHLAGLWLHALDLARVASLHLTTLQAAGRQVLPSEWMAALRPSVRGEVGLDCFAQFSSVHPGHRMGFGHDGDLGQWVTVQPAADAVRVRIRIATEDNQRGLWRDCPSDVQELVG